MLGARGAGTLRPPADSRRCSPSAALPRRRGRSSRPPGGGGGRAAAGARRREAAGPGRGMSGSESESEQEQYSSAEDDDYVPSGAEYSEDDESELVREEEPADSPPSPRGRRSRPASRKRKKGGLLLEADEKEEEKTQQNGEDQKEEEVDNAEQVERSREEEEKKKEDALWASFLSDVGQKPKAVAATQGTQIKKTEEENSGNKPQEKPKDSGKVTITKTFDFAGEEIKVTKEVDSNSKEAKSFLKQQEKLQSAAPASLPTVSGISVGARLGLEGVMIWAGGKRGRQPVSSSDSLHRFRLKFFNPHKSFILVRK
nr:craniofacial development protein 1 isoform X2 [Taeniopygia guttata]